MMRAGLLVCDHVIEKYQHIYGDYPDMFAQLFPELEWVLYDVVNGQFPDDIDDCEVYFATGSRYSVYDDEPWITQLLETIRLIREKGKYFVGFCFGHQALGQALGGKVQKAPTGWCVGVHEFALHHVANWMVPQQSTINLLMMCRDQVLEWPPEAIVLAGNEKCPIGMMQIGGRMLGIQAHPEFSKAYDQFLIQRRAEMMGAEVVKAGIESLEKTVHREVLRVWVLQFLGVV
jgi:GMP synthase-like glutamine amidotransferase